MFGGLRMLNANEFEKLGRLLNSLHQCMDIKFALMDKDAKEVYTASYKTAFCRAIASTPGGYERCVKCDQMALSNIQGTKKMKQYRCHAGLIEVALPVTENGETIAIIVFGQMLDDSPWEEQWKRISTACSWYPDMDELHQAFLHLKRISTQQIVACTEIVHACVSEVRLSGIVASANQNDLQRLTNYINTHYASDISVESLCKALSIGKTKLYSLCKTRLHKTVSQLVNERRMDAAKELLRTTDHSIQYISDIVGIADFNYFTKVFRRSVGMTPSEYRKRDSSPFSY